MSKENYDTKQVVLEALPQEAVKSPTIPVDVFMQEAENLFVWAEEDKETLIAKGLDWQVYAEDLPTRTGACRYAQAVWMKERYSQEEAAKAWREESPKAYEFRNDLLADLRFAFRKRLDLLARVRAIADGEGDADMIQDLMDISVLGKANIAELEKAKYDLSNFDMAAQQSDSLAELLAKANGATLDNSKAKEIRDRAYTHLKEAIDELRETGKYAFRKDPERYKGYISQYKRR
ncbi:hypothetical protein IWQ47_003048 [Aquimarina sp. EL_43]|uniref:hypothetical protein n=1 Tax=unclassified Aquimarina TaxID=2627091 RepID=UPI0018CABCC7|nr:MULTISPECIES: hypothetical protein [unclassified Aquimarina]MBG6131632.1 hypothetical protein [Aquimarina sp. EL_35]MBG6152093.1 hypothetical protein [Aquimarina sp. EL_32]MBG6169963.1 hypothetical protein [Aquimarina sp. EL_43]